MQFGQQEAVQLFEDVSLVPSPRRRRQACPEPIPSSSGSSRQA
jgi:hypothetical protein